MKKAYLIPIIAAVVIILGIISWQTSFNTSIGRQFFEGEQETKDALIKDYLDEQSYLQSRIVFLRKEIEDSQKNVEALSENSNLEILEKLKRDVGLSEVQGEGLEILLNDSPDAERGGVELTADQLIQASDLRDIVNILYSADASAVAINKQRVISTSTISSIGTTILVNNTYLAPPFTISVVGDKEIMLQRLLNKDLLPSIYERSKKFKLRFQIYVKKLVTIPIYNGDLKVNYINLVE